MARNQMLAVLLFSFDCLVLLYLLVAYWYCYSYFLLSLLELVLFVIGGSFFFFIFLVWRCNHVPVPNGNIVRARKNIV